MTRQHNFRRGDLVTIDKIPGVYRVFGTEYLEDTDGYLATLEPHDRDGTAVTADTEFLVPFEPRPTWWRRALRAVGLGCAAVAMMAGAAVAEDEVIVEWEAAGEERPPYCFASPEAGGGYLFGQGYAPTGVFNFGQELWLHHDGKRFIYVTDYAGVGCIVVRGRLVPKTSNQEVWH